MAKSNNDKIETPKVKYVAEQSGGWGDQITIREMKRIDANSMVVIDEKNDLQLRDINNGSLIKAISLGKSEQEQCYALFAMPGLLLTQQSGKITAWDPKSLEALKPMDVFCRLSTAVQYDASRLLSLSNDDVHILLRNAKNPDEAKLGTVFTPSEEATPEALTVLDSGSDLSFAVGLDNGNFEIFTPSKDERQIVKTDFENSARFLASLQQFVAVGCVGSIGEEYGTLKVYDSSDQSCIYSGDIPSSIDVFTSVFNQTALAITALHPSNVHYWDLMTRQFDVVPLNQKADACFVFDDRIVTTNGNNVNIYRVKMSPELEQFLSQTLGERLLVPGVVSIVKGYTGSSFLMFSDEKKQSEPDAPSETADKNKTRTPGKE